jgi:hypothetical protein
MSQDSLPSPRGGSNILLAFSNGPVTNTTLIAKSYTLEQLAQRLSAPKIGDKNGSYYIRGGELSEPRRADETLLSGSLIVLDGDSRICPVTGEVLPGAPPLDEVCAALDDIGLRYIAHTSHSHRPDEGVNKYRILLPAALPDAAALDAGVGFVIDQLHQRGAMLCDVAENRRWSQAWFLPRVCDQISAENFSFVSRLDEMPFPMVAALDHARDRKAEQAAIQAARLPPMPRASIGPGDSVIEEFNAEHGQGWVQQQLTAAGYRFAYRHGDQERYIRPGSETGVPGVVLFQGARGDWCTYSHHGSDDPLSEKLSDPFALYTIFQHGGDRQAAARHLGRERTSSVIQQAQRVSDGNRVELAVAEPPAEPDQPQARIHVEMASELKAAKTRWLIDGLLPSGGYCALYGQPGSYKSFVALYMAGMIAAGAEAFGRKTQPGSVIYVAGEGGAGLKRRWDALRLHHGLDADLPLGFVRSQLNLRSDASDMAALVEAINSRSLTPSLIVIDTLARAFAGGDENSASDMGGFISITNGLRGAYGEDTTILIVHHSGKAEAAGMRGSSALLGAVDTELQVTKTGSKEDRTGEITVTKQKDGEDDLVLPYRLHSVRVDPIDPTETSLALEPIEDADRPQQAEARRMRPGGDDMALDALSHAVLDYGQRSSAGQPIGVTVVSLERWRTEFYARRPASSEDARLARSAARMAFTRSTERLIAAGEVGYREGMCWRITGAQAVHEADEF